MTRKAKLEIKPLMADTPVCVSPTLAGQCGFNQALALQQVHFWCEYNRQTQKSETHLSGNRWWMHRTYAEWQAQTFTWMKSSSVQRLFKKLESDGLILARYNPGDPYRWYAVNYEKLQSILPSAVLSGWLKPQSEPDETGEGTSQGDKGEDHKTPGGDLSNCQGGHGETPGGTPQIVEGDSSKRQVQTLYIDSRLNTDQTPVEPEIGERPTIFKLYEQNIGIITPLVADQLKQAEEDYPKSWIEDAMQEAVKQNVRRWAYVSAILERWRRDGRGAASVGRNTTGNGKKKYPRGHALSDEFDPGPPMPDDWMPDEPNRFKRGMAWASEIARRKAVNE